MEDVTYDTRVTGSVVYIVVDELCPVALETASFYNAFGKIGSISPIS